MKETMILIMALSGLASCATPNPHEFSPGDVPKSQFSKDEYECERDARNIHVDSCTQMEMYEKCMKARGYSAIHGSASKGLCARVF